jgi:hypothetical protein
MSRTLLLSAADIERLLTPEVCIESQALPGQHR